jgi:hypothetical protein
MKTIRLALATLLGFALIYSCTKEKSFETGGGGTVSTDWEFKEGKTYKGNIDTAYIEAFGTPVKTLFLEGTSLDGKELLSIEVIDVNSSAPATYVTPHVLFQYLSSTAALYASDITSSGDFTVVISKIDSVSVSGTFTGKVKDTAGASKTIVEGKFKAKIKNGTVNPPPVQNGKLTFWAKSSCTAGGNITVKLSNNQTGAISAFTANEPGCEAAGAANFTLPAGNYTWKANCGTSDSTSGVITVLANQCVKQEVFFAAATDCHISDLAFYDFATSTPLGTIRSIYNASNRVTNVRLIDSINNAVTNDFVITYPAGRVQIDADQYFLIDGSSRITEFHGYDDPSDNTSNKIVMKYTYDASGSMTQYTMEDADTLNVIIWKGILQWTNGNLVKITENDPSDPTSDKYETTYDYNPSTVKNFISIIPLPELTYFQTAVNSGKNSLNSIKTETLKSITSTGTTTTLSITNYDNYNIDPAPNSYVRNFRITTVGDPYSTKVVLSYKCF